MDVPLHYRIPTYDARLLDEPISHQAFKHFVNSSTKRRMRTFHAFSIVSNECGCSGRFGALNALSLSSSIMASGDAAEARGCEECTVP